MKSNRKLKTADDLFPSEYLKVSDLKENGGSLTLQIERLDLKEFTDPETRETEEKPVLYFKGADKSLILNKTNAKRLHGLLGSDLDGWTGKEIVLHIAMVESFGKIVEAIRVE